MLKPNGYTFETTLDGDLIEGETFMCRHCNRHMHVKPRQNPEDLGGHCPNCFGLLCPSCVGKMTHGANCEPIELWVQRVEEGWRKLQQQEAA